MRYLDRTVEAVATAFFIAMFGAALLQVMARYVLFVPIPWTEELARILFSWSMLLGIAVAIRRREHVRVLALLERFPAPLRTALEIAFAVVILLLLLSLARGTLQMARVTWNSHLIALSWVRTGYLYAGQLVAIGLMFLAVVLETISLVRDGRTDRRDDAVAEPS
ncbi:MAG: TRAP transporter small permease [Zetaproteobacteria bacterium]|nr:MAG: TRAP transporter small permease [Zetaproteobacteria bacterium]